LRDDITWAQDFVFVSSDTREIFQYFNANTLEKKDKKVIMDDITNKTERLTNNVLISIGGLMEIGRDWKDYMFKHSEEHFYLDDLEPVMKESYKYLNSKNDKFYKKYLESNYIGAFLTGFYRNGDTGCFMFHEGQFQSKRMDKETCFTHMFAPTQDILDKKDELLNFNNIPNTNDNTLESIINYYSLIQAIVATQHSDLVSNRFLGYCLMRKEDGEIYYQELDWDLSEIQKQLI